MGFWDSCCLSLALESVKERVGSVEGKSLVGISSASDLDQSEKQMNERVCV